jgi:hypothetical protein
MIFRQQNRLTAGQRVRSTGFSAFGSRLRSFLPHSDCVDDQIHIEQLEVFAHIGVPDEERSTPQRLTFRGFPALCGMF